MSWLRRLIRREWASEVHLAPGCYTYVQVETKVGERVTVDASFMEAAKVFALEPLAWLKWQSGAGQVAASVWTGFRLDFVWLPPRPDKWTLVLQANDRFTELHGQVTVGVRG